MDPILNMFRVSGKIITVLLIVIQNIGHQGISDNPIYKKNMQEILE